MKYSWCLIVAILVFFLSGCFILPERVENHVQYVDNVSPPQITVIWHNLWSDANTDEELKKDFDEFIQQFRQNKTTEIFLGNNREVLIQSSEMYVENGKLQLRVSAIPVGEELEDNASEAKPKFEDLASDGERILVLDKEYTGKIKTNGQLLQTERNYIIAWPEKEKALYWSNQIYPNGVEEIKKEDWNKAERNRVKLLKLYEEYKASGKL